MANDLLQRFEQFVFERDITVAITTSPRRSVEANWVVTWGGTTDDPGAPGILMAPTLTEALAGVLEEVRA